MSVGLTPRVRARAVQDAIAAVDVFETGSRQRVRERVPEASWQIITDTLPLDWVTIEHDRHVVAAFVDVLGHDRAHAFFRKLLVQQLESSLLRSTAAAALRMFGVTPGGLARAVPVGWRTTYRDFGRARVVRLGVGATSIVLEAVAPEVFDTPAYAESFCGFFAGFFDVCRVAGRAQSNCDPRTRRIEIALRWTEARDGPDLNS